LDKRGLLPNKMQPRTQKKRRIRVVNDVKVSLNLYGEQAKTLAKELGLECSRKTADVSMTAHFSYRDVEGRTVVSAMFTQEETLGKLAEFVNHGVTQAVSDEAKAAFAVVKTRMEILGLTKEAI
jgi:hypothetical protein